MDYLIKSEGGVFRHFVGATPMYKKRVFRGSLKVSRNNFDFRIVIYLMKWSTLEEPFSHLECFFGVVGALALDLFCLVYS